MPPLKAIGFNTGSCRAPHFATQEGAGLNLIDHPNMAVVIEHPTEGLIVFDTGYDQAYFEACQTWPERLYPLLVPVTFDGGQSLVVQMKSIDLDPQNVRHVIISHFHADHIAGLHHFPQARWHCAKAGLDQITTLKRFSRVRRGLIKALIPPRFTDQAAFFEDAKTTPLSPDLRPFDTGHDILGDGSILAIALPGHCPGHYGILIKDDELGDHFFVADAAWSTKAIQSLRAPPYFTSQALGNAHQGRETLQKLKSLIHRNHDICLTPCHCPKRHEEWVKPLSKSL